MLTTIIICFHARGLKINSNIIDFEIDRSIVIDRFTTPGVWHIYIYIFVSIKCCLEIHLLNPQKYNPL